MDSHDSPGLTRRQMLKTGAGALAVGLTMPGVLFSQTTPSRSARIGLLGAAHVHLDRYARLMRDAEGIEVAAVYDDTPEIAAHAREVTGGAGSESAEALLATDGLDAVVVLSENNKHRDYAIAAARSGRHLFVEKPLDFDGDRADEIAEAVREAGVLFQTGYFMRSMAQLRFLRDAVREGSFGKLTRIRLQYAHGGSLSGMWDGYHSWMVDREQVGRGALGDLGIHILNMLLWMTEGDPIESLSAHIGNATGRFDGIDEYGEAAIRFESGLLATLGSGYVDRNDVNRIEISGTEGHAYMNSGRLFLSAPAITGVDRETYWSDFPDSLEHPFSLFLHALRGSDVPLIPVEEAARDVRVMDRIYDAVS